MTAVTDLAAWLLEQIEADRRRVKSVRRSTAEDEGWDDETRARIEAEHDPVMIDLDAKQQIVADHKIIVIWPNGTAGAKFYAGGKRVCASCDDRMPVPCRTLRYLALPYADRTGYLEEWRP